MNTIDGLPVDAGRDDKLKKTEPEDGLYNVVDDQKVSSSRELSVVHPATEQLAAVPYLRHAFLNKAISDAQNAFSGRGAVPFGRRKAILSSVLNKIAEHANELSALLAAEQAGLLAEARWEIDLLTKTFGPALMQMEPSENKRSNT
jgi:acyl-CoA reductase-like NAD-dependent aldehyde dehydrogenase